MEVYNKTYALRHGIERSLVYNADAGCFEGDMSRDDVGHDKVHARVYLLSPEEWGSVLMNVGFTDVCIYAPGVDKPQRLPCSAKIIEVVAILPSR